MTIVNQNISNQL